MGYFQKVFLPSQRAMVMTSPPVRHTIVLSTEKAFYEIGSPQPKYFPQTEKQKKFTRCVFFSTRKLNKFKKQKQVFRQKARLQILIVIQNGNSLRKKNILDILESNCGGFEAFKDVNVNITSKIDAIRVDGGS